MLRVFAARHFSGRAEFCAKRGPSPSVLVPIVTTRICPPIPRIQRMRSGGGQAGRRQLEQPDASRRAIASAGTPSPEPIAGSMAEGVHHVLPENHRLSVTRIAGLLLANGRVDHHQPALRVDEDPLAPHAEEREPPLLARKDPGLVAVTEKWRRDPGPQVVLLRMLARAVRDPRGGDDLTPPPVTIVGEQETEPRVVAQHRVEAAIGRLLARAVH